MNIQVQEQLCQQYPYKIEMHAHSSPCSHCSEVAPEDVVLHYKQRGYHAIVMTNHFNPKLVADGDAAVSQQMDDYRRACKAGEELGVKVLLGSELRFTENDNDYLVYGVNENDLRHIFDLLHGSAADFRKNANLPECLFIQAHPFRPHCTVLDAELLDGIEVFNLHPHHLSRNQVAQEFALAHPELIVTAGSDYHHDTNGHCGTTALLSRTLPQDSFELAKILRSRDYILKLQDSLYIP